MMDTFILSPEGTCPSVSDLIDVLEDALREVREGKISALAIICHQTQGTPEFKTAWLNSFGPAYPLMLAGATEFQHALLMHGLTED